jgi:uncharacterized protein (DUF2336 family)
MSNQAPVSLPFLASLAAAENAESRRILLRITTDHFISRQDHSPRQLAHFEKTMLRLIAKSDAAARLGVARKIARHPMAPARVLSTIEEMGGDGALHVLEFAPLPRDRLAAAAFGHQSRACALARRADLDAELVAALGMRPEPEVALTLARNLAASIDAQTFAALARRAEREKPLAEALLSRPSGGVDPAALFLLASSAQRAAILAAAQRMELARPGAATREPDHEDSIARLERYALEREPELFVATLAQLLGCSRDLAERIAKEPSGEPLAVALAAFDAPQDVAVRILISGDLQSGAKYTRLGSLIRLGVGLNPAAARRVVSALVGAPKGRRAQHQPVLDATASATPSRAAPGTTNAREGAPAGQTHQRPSTPAPFAPTVRKSG